MRKRLDEMMVEQQLVGTRARARGLILRGHVRVSGRLAEKAGLMVAPGANIEIDGSADLYVSFGAEKLLSALDAFGSPFDPMGRIALDVGASTGGFTDVLLRRGARRVYAVDVGRGQLHPSLAKNPKVISIEDFDARSITRSEVPDQIEALVADVSFISLTKVLGPAMSLTGPGAWLIALIKPQFEVGPGAIGKGGIVRSKGDREGAVRAVQAWLAVQPNWRVENVITWPGLQGRSNEEYLIGAVHDG